MHLHFRNSWKHAYFSPGKWMYTINHLVQLCHTPQISKSCFTFKSNILIVYIFFTLLSYHYLKRIFIYFWSGKCEMLIMSISNLPLSTCKMKNCKKEVHLYVRDNNLFCMITVWWTVSLTCTVARQLCCAWSRTTCVIRHFLVGGVHMRHWRPCCAVIRHSRCQ